MCHRSVSVDNFKQSLHFIWNQHELVSIFQLSNAAIMNGSLVSHNQSKRAAYNVVLLRFFKFFNLFKFILLRVITKN